MGTACANSHIVMCIDLFNVTICSYSHRNIALAWLVTVPVSGLISAASIALLREIVLWKCVEVMEVHIHTIWLLAQAIARCILSQPQVGLKTLLKISKLHPTCLPCGQLNSGCCIQCNITNGIYVHKCLVSCPLWIAGKCFEGDFVVHIQTVGCQVVNRRSGPKTMFRGRLWY
jgi:hypothetical protein